jgi:hypothetical protein
MNNENSMTRRKLTEKINEKKDALKRDLLMVTAFRATKDGSLQVEFCQNRALGGKKLTALQLLNRSDKRFGGETTLVFDWLTMKPEDYLKTFKGQTDATLEGLQAIAATWTPDAPTGKDAIVYPQLDTITKFYDSVNEEELTPVISVTEIVESKLNTFYRGDNAQEKAQDTIDRGNAVMKTGSGDDAEYLVHPESGEKIYRFARTEFKEHGATDTIIPGKMPLSQFIANAGDVVEANTANPSEVRNSILGQSSTIK